jgi:hypothetical protein
MHIYFTIWEKILGPKGEELEKGSQVLRFWRLMSKGEKVLSPKQNDRTPTSKILEMKIYLIFTKVYF